MDFYECLARALDLAAPGSVRGLIDSSMRMVFDLATQEMAWQLEEAVRAGLVGRGPCQPALESCEMLYRNSSLHSYCLQIPSRVNSP